MTMRRPVWISLAMFLAPLVWAAILLADMLGGWWRTPLAPPGDGRAQVPARFWWQVLQD
jgi:hypothetical protein